MLQKAFERVAAYHLHNRGTIGYGAGLAAGAVAAHSGLGFDAMAGLARVLSSAQAAPEQINVLASSLYAVPSLGVFASCVIVDAGIHYWRKRGAAPAP